MKILRAKELNNLELPFQFLISFHKPFLMFEKYASESNQDHPFHKSAKVLIKKLESTPELIDGFSDYSLLKKHQEKIEMLLKPLFPESLLENEIKSASIPFSFTSFLFSTRFENIIKNAGDGYDLAIRDLKEEVLYIHACTMILGMVYGYDIDLRRPFFFDIPDKDGVIRNYRVAFNADLGEIIPTEKAIKITEEDYKMLIDSFDDVAVWKAKFPPGSYIFKGFGIMNLFDVTSDEVISEIKNNLLRSDSKLVADLQDNLRKFYSIKDLNLGLSVFGETSARTSKLLIIKKSGSLILGKDEELYCDGFFCDSILNKVFKDVKPVAISEMKKHGEKHGQTPFYKRMIAKGINSIMLVPIKSKGATDIAVLEIASPRPYELNSLNLHKLKDIVPVFKAAGERIAKEQQNMLEATIQKYYTAIHPTVKWRFYDAAAKFHEEVDGGKENVKIDEIVFSNVYPLFGQSDIKGSSVARNEAIREDLITQLTLAKNTLNQICKQYKLPIYEGLIFHVNEYLTAIEQGLNSGDEIDIFEFLKQEVHPTFKHISKNNELFPVIEAYNSRLDNEINAVYEKRKDYENSVTLLNSTLAKFIDNKQEVAQKTFPHYFERYKTDGIEHNMYIGQSLVKDEVFEPLYLHNLRMWQLQMMYEVENLAYATRKEMNHDLRIASLILVHSSPLTIRFRMDEKQFDVDGAYNIRYEIIKKRVDKAHIKGTNDRITVPGKLTIVYSHEADAIEYEKYIKFLQSKKLLGKVEKLELEDLQGASGLKALRVEVTYKNDYSVASQIAINDLIKEIQA